MVSSANSLVCRVSGIGVGRVDGSSDAIRSAAGLVAICNRLISALMVTIHEARSVFCVGGVVGLVSLNLPCHAVNRSNNACSLVRLVASRLVKEACNRAKIRSWV